jgi:GlcNAc-PI de-N-acetylase
MQACRRCGGLRSLCGAVGQRPRGVSLTSDTDRVIAHPDDETFVSPILAHYARAGVRVYVVIATNGSQGVSPRAGIPAGDSLAAIRVGEARCVARELGLRSCVEVALTSRCGPTCRSPCSAVHHNEVPPPPLHRNRLMRRWLIACVAAAFLGPSLVCAQARAYDIVIQNGRVIDPESGLDAVRSVGIRGATLPR